MTPEPEKMGPHDGRWAVGKAVSPRALLEVEYRFDLLGRVVHISRLDTGEQIAAYGYLPDGSFATESLRNGSCLRTFRYDSLGRLLTIADPAFTQSLSFRQGGIPLQPCGRGTIEAEKFVFRAAAFATAKPKDYRFVYRWDAFRRLINATKGESGNEVVQLSYDANGNILQFNAERLVQTYQYASGSNRLKEWQSGTASSVVSEYTPDGALALRKSGAMTLAFQWQYSES